MDPYLDAVNAGGAVGRALAIHYPAQSSTTQNSYCAVCWHFSSADGLMPDRWPCATVRVLTADADLTANPVVGATNGGTQ